MPRPKGAKNKSVSQKVEDIIADMGELKAESPEQAAEIAEAVIEIKDIISPKVKAPKVYVGKHPITGEAVYV